MYIVGITISPQYQDQYRTAQLPIQDEDRHSRSQYQDPDIGIGLSMPFQDETMSQDLTSMPDSEW